MCGITGIFAFNLIGKLNMIHVTNATIALEKRGPDFMDIYTDQFVGLGHRRLSIIDTSAAGNQPMWDDSKRYCIIFNGEIFNFKSLRHELEQKGVSFNSQSDTEVLLKLYIVEGKTCLDKLNGFFAFCIYDKAEQTFFLARDRYGIKPLLYLFDEDKFIFASEMKAILQYGIERPVDQVALYNYLQLNYIPAPSTIFKTVKKLMPGHCLTLRGRDVAIEKYYEIPYDREAATKPAIDYDEAKKKLSELLEQSVQQRLIADVPLGSFLSGGIDSSVVSALAARHKPDLHTFSIGYRDEKFFDETQYAQLVSKKLNTRHTVFSLSNNDLYSHLHSILNYIDEPFGDSSAIAVFILSKQTRQHSTVALSGDGADELLGGYNKHAAFLRTIRPGLTESVATSLGWLWKMLPQSRNDSLSNRFRQLSRFAKGMKLPPKERYWLWAGFASETEALQLIHPSLREGWYDEYELQKAELTKNIPENPFMNDILLEDMKIVLLNDMLMKVDLMSMANSLEIRVPFLDYKVVDYIFSLPDHYKIDRSIRKKILQDTFRDVLPAELYKRPKKGFEVPLLKWFRNEMRSMIVDDLLSEELVEQQGIFHYPAINKLKKQLFSSNPGDVHARIWGLIVFQQWWKNNLMKTKSDAVTTPNIEI